ncbi:hypothetical protein GCM10009801_41370 [Streptomyces albiaxialis]|uniref:Secreted protein n=1 Tax=Streptomyces albiaxialis TaxID=329523 RepID=A0ABN2W4S6_9ACTN
MTGISPLPYGSARTAAAAGLLTVALLGLAPYAHADDGAAPEPPAPPEGAAAAAHKAASADGTLGTLARFFARDGAVTANKADPRVKGGAVPVYTLARDFVAAESASRAAARPVAELELFASEAVSSDGQRASVMSARTPGGWRVVNIATGADETRYAAKGAAKAPGGTVFQEPQIDAWYVLDGGRVLPLDPDARKAVGAKGTSLGAYHARVHKAYADKLPGSGYDKKGLAGGFGPQKGNNDSSTVTTASEPSEASEASAADGGPSAPLAAVGASAGAVLAAAGGTWLVRRRLRPSSHG